MPLMCVMMGRKTCSLVAPLDRLPWCAPGGFVPPPPMQPIMMSFTDVNPPTDIAMAFTDTGSGDIVMVFPP